MEIIRSVSDLRTWINNSNPGNVIGESNFDGAVMDQLVDAFRGADGRPAWGDDWEEWLEANGERIAIDAIAEE